MSKRFADQTVVVIGSATGLGQAMALRFAREGARLILGDVDPRLEGVVANCRAAGAEAWGLRTDVSAAEEVARLAEEAKARFGPVHIVCSNAGVNECPGPAWELEPHDWEWVLGVNLLGLANVVRSFVPLMIAQGFGHLVSTASNTSLAATSNVGAYVASKKANRGLCETLQMDLWQARSPVKVSVICPGKIIAEMPDIARARPAALAGRTPTPEQVAAMRAWLAVGGKTPDETAAAALDGIAEQRFYIVTHDGDVESAETWANGVRSGRLALGEGETPRFDATA